MDYAALPGRVTTEATEDEAAGEDEARAPQTAVRFDQLDDDDQRRLIEYIDDLEEKSKFLTVKFLVERIAHTSVLPTLSEAQLKGLLLDMIVREIFEVSESKVNSPMTGEPFIRRELALDIEHPSVSRWIEAV